MSNTTSKNKKKPYHLYAHGDGRICIVFKVKNEDGTETTKTLTRSTKKHSYKEAKKQLIDAAYSQMGILRQQVVYHKPNKDKILSVSKFGVEPTTLITTKNMDEIDWKELFSKSITMCIFASSRSGKTTFLANLYKNHIRSLFDLNILGTGSLNADIYKDFKKCIKLSGINEDFIKSIYTIQKKTKGKHYKMVQIYDDVDVKSKYIDIINKCFFKMRNYNISSILSVQDMKMVDKGVRNNCHLIMVMNTTRMDESRLQYLFEVLQPYFRDKIGELSSAQQKKAIIKWLHNTTQDYGFILIDTLQQKIYHCLNKL
jgi:hypothetical protein